MHTNFTAMNFLYAISAALLASGVQAMTSAQVSTAQELREALVTDGVQHILITNHLDLSDLVTVAALDSGALGLPLEAAVSTATIRVCFHRTSLPSARINGLKDNSHTP